MNSIHNLHHSKRYHDELISAPLPHDNDLVALHFDLVAAIGRPAALEFGRSLTGMRYAEKVSAMRQALTYVAEYDAQQPADLPEAGYAQAADVGYGGFGPM